MPEPEPVIRPRRDKDLPACSAALRGVHETDGHPVRWPADPHEWLTPKGMLGVWIAAGGSHRPADHHAIR